MKISVVIPSYMPGEYVEECLQSLWEQSLEKELWEVVLVLNGPEMPYREYLQGLLTGRFAGLNSRLFYTDVKGVSNARNVGIENARGEYITFVDDDDVVSPNYLEELLRVSTPTCVGCANSYSFATNTEHGYDNFITKHFRNCQGKRFSLMEYRGFLSPPCAKMIHRDIIGESRFKRDLVYGEDGVFCFSLVPRIGEMRLVEDDGCAYFVRDRVGSATRSGFDRKKEWSQLLKLERAFLSYYFKKPSAYTLLFLLSRLGGSARNMINRYHSNKKK